VDAHVRKEGFAALAPAMQFLHDLLEQFWDTLYPPIDEDGDMEVRAAPLVWLGVKLAEPLGFVPIVSGKLSWHQYQESRTVGYEADADTSEKQEARENRIKEGKITAEQFDEAIEATSVSSLRDIYKQLNQGKDAVQELADFCDMQFGDFAPSFIKTRDAIEEIAQTVRIILGKKPGGLEEEAAEPIDDFSVGLSSEVETSTPSELEAEPAETAAPRGAVNGFAGQLGSICRAMRAKDPEDPAPYLILRGFAWASIMFQSPMLDRSAIEAPESDLRVKLKRLTADGEWDKLLDLTESTMLRPCARYWLDMQRYAVNAIEQKNSPGIARVVINQLRVLLEMMPDLIELTFPDDTPAANPETQEWITNFVIHQAVPPREPEAGESSDSSSDFSFDASSSDATPAADETPSFDASSWDSTSSAESTPESESIPEALPEPEPYVVEENPPLLEAEEPPPSDTSDEFGQALQAVRDGRTAEGLGIITGILATERSGRARFRRRTQLAHLLMAAGKGKVAQPLLDQLAAEIEERHLEDWEPSEAIAYPLELLMHCLTSADDERRTQLYTRICKLDPVRAVNCSV
jgi:type VI secretion system protein ImpA